ncbi:MAG TPA: penicillin-binding protein 2 [Caulobacteraceae bacterium]|nr:penicillin-binding protein 2 [Caulobacteraceae bacterium]
MSEPAIFYNEVNERQSVFNRRAVLMGGLASLGLTALGGRLVQLQIVENNRYTSLALSNQYNFRIVPPPRGLIVDRNGVALASNRPSFRLLLLKDEVTNPSATIDAAAELIPISPQHKREILRDINQGPRFIPVAIAEDLSWDEFARVNVRTPELPGLQADMNEIRVYPYGGAFAHVIGYVSKVTAAELKAAGPNPDPLLLNPGFRIGQQGIERSLDLQLRGKAGGKKVEVNARGRVVREDPAGDIKPVPGQQVVLNLDADIQNRALEVFGDQSGAAVMMDCHTGELLCMMSAPSFDANDFVKGVPTAEYEALSNYERKPLFNKVLTANYPPGSTFKTMVALTALEMGVPTSRQYTCNGAWAWGGRVWHCDQAHGTLDMKGGIAHSCDIYFYQLALALGGPDPIAKTARMFGLGALYDIGIAKREQRPGIIPDTAYKRKNFPKDPVWHPGETPSVGIGQGYVSVNALQLCVMCSRIANGRTALYPKLIRSVGGAAQPPGAAEIPLAVNLDNLAFIREAMAAVVTSGTAAAVPKLDLGPIAWAGKTGTAQAHGGHTAHGAVGAWAERDHSWFIAFAPADAPRYAMSCLVEHGGFGADAAAPRAREIMRVALLKDPDIRNRITQPAPLENAPTAPPAAAAQPAAQTPAPAAPTPTAQPT